MSELRTFLPEHDLMFLGGIPAVYHCHHFNLFLDQTIDDALGTERGTELRFRAAREAAGELLRALAEVKGAVTRAERLALAHEVFAMMGHGRLAIDATPTGGSAHGEHLHYGYTWKEKYGHTVRRTYPADAFAAGWAAAAVELGGDLAPESVSAVERQCVAMRAPGCTFELAAGTAGPRLPPVRREQCLAAVQPSFEGRDEATISKITNGLRGFTAGVAGDERGLVQAFGVFVTAHLAGYYNRISYDAVHETERTAPQSIGMIEELLRESGHVCVFNTFGGILLSPEWEGMVGPLSGDPYEIVLGCLAIARALGFGKWTVADFVPGERLVVRAPCSYESVYYLSRHGRAPRPNEYFLQGAVLAIAQLAHRVDWKSKPRLTQETYSALFRGSELPWKVEQTSSTTMGHSRSEVVATKR